MEAERLKKFLDSEKKANLGNLFEYLQGIAEGLEGVVRWEAREKIGGQSVRENDLEHTFKMVFLTIICAVAENNLRDRPDKLDVGLLATMALFHDIGEIAEGDMAGFIKVGKGAEPHTREIAAIERIVAPLPHNVQEHLGQALRHAIRDAPNSIDSKESRFFRSVEELGFMKRGLHECRLGNLHFAPKCLEWYVANLQEYAKEFPTLKALFEPMVPQAKAYLEEFKKQRKKYLAEFIRRGGKKEDFPF